MLNDQLHISSHGPVILSCINALTVSKGHVMPGRMKCLQRSGALIWLECFNSVDSRKHRREGRQWRFTCKCLATASLIHIQECYVFNLTPGKGQPRKTSAASIYRFVPSESNQGEEDSNSGIWGRGNNNWLLLGGLNYSDVDSTRSMVSKQFSTWSLLIPNSFPYMLEGLWKALMALGMAVLWQGTKKS